MAMPRATGSCSTPPIGTPTGGARTTAVPTAWPTAGTNPAPASPPWAPCASPPALWSPPTRAMTALPLSPVPTGLAPESDPAWPVAPALTGLVDASPAPSLFGLSPAAVRRLDAAALEGLAADIRSFLIDAVASTGGHLGSNLGAVELTLALHKVFDSPRDRVVWDTGHQTYVHKIVTGRAGDFAGLRRAAPRSRAPTPRSYTHST